MPRQPPAPIPLPPTTAPGNRPQESGGRLINCYTEPLGDTASSKMVWRRSPGLVQFAADAGFTNFRGAIFVNGVYYAAFANHLVAYDALGTPNVVPATLGGTTKVFFARNNLVPTPQIACVTENGAFLVTASTITAWPDLDLPVPNSVCFQDGYFFFTIGDRRCFATDINSTSVNPLSFITAESKTQDTLIRAIPWSGMLFLCATASIEVWQDTANPAPSFPYSRSFVIQRGLAGPSAIAGWEDGFGHALIWVGDDNKVYQLNGQTPIPISSSDLDRLIALVTDKTQLDAFVYVHSGHPIWALSSNTWTWEFDLTTGKWRERVSGTGPFQRWRATGNSQFAFGRWLMGDTQSGQIINPSDLAFTELGATQLMRLESGPVEGFPNRVRVARADFDFVTGVGIATGTDPIQTDPSVEISWSDDGGVNWGNPLIRKLGRQQQSKTRVTVLNTGRTGPMGRRWRLDVSDPVYVGLLQGTQDVQLHNN